MSFVRERTIKTGTQGMYNITKQVAEAIRQSGVLEGVAYLHCPHTTAGVVITENTDADVLRDMMFGLDKALPDRPEYRHKEGNSFAHIKSSVVGCTLTLIVTGGWPLLGPWQGVFFCEFDGPRERRFVVKVAEC